MPQTYNNKVILGNEVLMDISQDTITADKLLSSYTAHDASGAPITGTCTYDADTSDADALVGEVISGKTFYKNGQKLTGTMTNRGQYDVSVSDLNGTAIPQGYHDGSGVAAIDSESAALIIPENIRENITFLGVTGTMSGSEAMNPQAKSVTPTLSSQTISPDEPTYNCLSQVTVAAIPVTRTSLGEGVCVTIAPVSA